MWFFIFDNWIWKGEEIDFIDKSSLHLLDQEIFTRADSVGGLPRVPEDILHVSVIESTPMQETQMSLGALYSSMIQT